MPAPYMLTKVGGLHLTAWLGFTPCVSCRVLTAHNTQNIRPLQASPEGLTRAAARSAVAADPEAVLAQGSCSVPDDERPPAKGTVPGGPSVSAVNFYDYYCR
jgi:hypothetical protein